MAALRAVLAALAAVYVGAQAVFLTQPLYLLSGDVVGRLGVLGYALEAFGRPVRSPALDSLAVLAVPVLLSMPAAAAAAALAARGRLWAALGGFGAAVLASGVSAGLEMVVAEVAHRLAADYSHATSAGRIYFHGTALADTAAALMPLVALLSSTAAMALTAAAMWPRGEEAGQVYEYEVT